MTIQSGTAMAVASTPMVAYETFVAGAWRTVLVKMETTHPSGSVKHRAAIALVDDVLARRDGDRDFVLVESTSGNLGVGLAMVCRAAGLPFVAVVDPRTQPAKLEKLRAAGATIELVDSPDASGSYLDARLARVAELCASDPRYVFADQYHNPAHPAVHRDTTAPEILRQTGGAVDWVIAAVSTGATLRGIRDGLVEAGLTPRAVAVDATGSGALGGPAGPRLMTGIGSTRPSAFLTVDDLDSVEYVDDRTAFAECWQFRRDTGVALGASGGAVLAATRALLARGDAEAPPVCVAADHGDDYLSTVYSRDWLHAAGHEQAAHPSDQQHWRSVT